MLDRVVNHRMVTPCTRASAGNKLPLLAVELPGVTKEFRAAAGICVAASEEDEPLSIGVVNHGVMVSRAWARAVYLAPSFPIPEPALAADPECIASRTAPGIVGAAVEKNSTRKGRDGSEGHLPELGTWNGFPARIVQSVEGFLAHTVSAQ